MPPPEHKINTSLVYYSHGSEVYHSPKNYQEVEDAGFNLQKLAWIESSHSPEAFQRVRILSELPNDMLQVEYEDHSKVHNLIILQSDSRGIFRKK